MSLPHADGNGQSNNSTTTKSVLDHAIEYLRAGFSLIPIRRDGSKAPAGNLLPRKIIDPDTGKCKSTWDPFKERLPTEDELRSWFDRQDPLGIALICGAVSRHLELIDFDHGAETTFRAWCEMVEA